MKRDWLELSLKLAETPAHFYVSDRKLVKNYNYSFRSPKADLFMEDAGFTRSKMTMLVRNYLHAESKEVARQLWDLRVAKRKYGSVSFTTFNHFVKGGSVEHGKRSKISGVFGPCIQSVSLTYMPKHVTHADIFYRNTELFKKFPADLVFFRDVLLAGFDFSTAPIETITFHFASITAHPMYFVTLIPHLKDPIDELEHIREADPKFFDHVIKWNLRYLSDDHDTSIRKYAQALRVKQDARTRISERWRKDLLSYMLPLAPDAKNDIEEGEDE